MIIRHNTCVLLEHLGSERLVDVLRVRVALQPHVDIQCRLHVPAEDTGPVPIASIALNAQKLYDDRDMQFAHAHFDYCLSFTVCSQAIPALHLQGAELIPQLTSGDVIVSAELVSGQNRLANAPVTAA